jgi:3-oxoacyl-[acyl-carrier protein] reductase
MAMLSKGVFLVTGSTRGIGRAIAERLLDEGATVAVHGRDPAKAAEELGGRAIPVAADLTDPERARELVREAASIEDRLDGLVNNAGGGEAKAFRAVTLPGWRETHRINLEAAMIAAQESYLVMRKQRSGSIVNIASIAAHGAGGWMGADYAASKAGLVSLTKSLAREAARFGIRCNAVSPGFVETDMTAKLPEANREKLNIPLGRLASPQDIAGVVLFLLSDLSSYITGQVLHVDGGLWMHG